jgi:hypothetical protein
LASDFAQATCGGVPVQAGVGHRNAVAQVLRPAQFLAAFEQMGFLHHALDAAAAIGDLMHHVLEHQRM